MHSVSRELLDIIERAKPRLTAISEAKASEKPYADKWCLKEILGHLTDSAANNHQRFVRMQEAEDIGTFTYAQLHWVNSQHYQEENWGDLVNLWYFYNKHLAFLIGHIGGEVLEHGCDIGYGGTATLRFVIEDYVKHLQHHLEQIFDDADPKQRRKWAQGE